MKIWKLAGSTALALVGFGGAVQAITPEEVWGNWQAYYAQSGAELTVGNTSRNGDTLEVSGIAIKMTVDGEASASIAFDKVNFKELGDGKVEITMSDVIPMEIFSSVEGESISAMKMAIGQTGMVTIASGTAEATSYEFTSPAQTIKITDIKDETGTPVDAVVDLALASVTGTYLVEAAGDQGGTLDSQLSAAGMDMTIVGRDADDGTEFTGTIKLADLKGSSKGGFVGADLMKTMATAVNAGFSTDSDFTFGAMSVDFAVTENGAPTNILAAATGGGLEANISKAGITYGTFLNGFDLSVSGAAIPLPEVKLTMAETSFNMAVPIAKADAPQDFSLVTKLVDLSVSDDLWGIIDPAGTLPRDPVTLIVDTKGTATLTADLMDETLQDTPGEVNTLDLNQVLAKALGAEVTADGGLTFDNSDLTTFGGMPAPTGAINVSLKGVNALIDNLIAIGILPEDQAMGARMMLGVFARPGAGPDELVSTIEFKDGGIFANGQQLQ
ncbi:MAG: DUF2125 domain-containing protein [Tabrizicola sp.]|nr:DUF2125 domain-containing protein [Tabrizicola sp.]